MRFDTPATRNSIDQLKVVGQPLDRIDRPLKRSRPRGTDQWRSSDQYIPNRDAWAASTSVPGCPSRKDASAPSALASCR